MRIRIPGNRFANKTVQILEHALKFAENGWAEADHLTDQEIQRCARLGFHIEATPKQADAPAEAAKEPDAPKDEPPAGPAGDPKDEPDADEHEKLAPPADGADEDDGDTDAEGGDPADGNDDAPAAKRTRGRAARRTK